MRQLLDALLPNIMLKGKLRHLTLLTSDWELTHRRGELGAARQ